MFLKGSVESGLKCLKYNKHYFRKGSVFDLLENIRCDLNSEKVKRA